MVRPHPDKVEIGGSSPPDFIRARGAIGLAHRSYMPEVADSSSVGLIRAIAGAVKRGGLKSRWLYVYKGANPLLLIRAVAGVWSNGQDLKSCSLVLTKVQILHCS